MTRNEGLRSTPPFLARLWRLYRYYRGFYVPREKPWATVYTFRPRHRREALWLAWGYARKGADAA